VADKVTLSEPIASMHRHGTERRTFYHSQV
jgi:hypothetical protein